MTLPEPRNSSALKNACVVRWKMPAAYAPVPTPRNMYPSCETVEYASTRLMLDCFRARVAANGAVSALTPATGALRTGDGGDRGPQRTTRGAPAGRVGGARISAV